LAKRVFEIAKELKVASKAVVEKCHAEGIPDTLIKNHMSTVSAGLEQTIREWFSESESAHTAVENTEKVNLEDVRVAPKKRRAGQASERTDDSSDDGGGVATAAPEADAPAAPPTPPPAPTRSPFAIPPKVVAAKKSDAEAESDTENRPKPTKVAAKPPAVAAFDSQRAELRIHPPHAYSQAQPATGELLHGGYRLRGRERRPVGEDEDASPQADARGLPGQPG